jgi:hypothetical protein
MLQEHLFVHAEVVLLLVRLHLHAVHDLQRRQLLPHLDLQEADVQPQVVQRPPTVLLQLLEQEFQADQVRTVVLFVQRQEAAQRRRERGAVVRVDLLIDLAGHRLLVHRHRQLLRHALRGYARHCLRRRYWEGRFGWGCGWEQIGGGECVREFGLGEKSLVGFEEGSIDFGLEGEVEVEGDVFLVGAVSVGLAAGNVGTELEVLLPPLLVGVDTVDFEVEVVRAAAAFLG